MLYIRTKRSLFIDDSSIRQLNKKNNHAAHAAHTLAQFFDGVCQMAT